MSPQVTTRAETLATREAIVKENRAAIIRANPAFDINAHIRDMHNWRALEMALAASPKEM